MALKKKMRTLKRHGQQDGEQKQKPQNSEKPEASEKAQPRAQTKTQDHEVDHADEKEQEKAPAEIKAEAVPRHARIHVRLAKSMVDDGRRTQQQLPWPAKILHGLDEHLLVKTPGHLPRVETPAGSLRVYPWYLRQPRLKHRMGRRS